eukprot:PhF_6_TR38695/c0_g1_i2/m.57897
MGCSSGKVVTNDASGAQHHHPPTTTTDDNTHEPTTVSFAISATTTTSTLPTVYSTSIRNFHSPPYNLHPSPSDVDRMIFVPIPPPSTIPPSAPPPPPLTPSSSSDSTASILMESSTTLLQFNPLGVPHQGPLFHVFPPTTGLWISNPQNPPYHTNTTEMTTGVDSGPLTLSMSKGSTEAQPA